jgi:hypothetical protein
VQAAKICHQKFSKICGECEIYRKANLQCVTVIEEVIHLIEESLHLGVHIDFFFLLFGLLVFHYSILFGTTVFYEILMNSIFHILYSKVFC